MPRYEVVHRIRGIDEILRDECGFKGTLREALELYESAKADVDKSLPFPVWAEKMRELLMQRIGDINA